MPKKVLTVYDSKTEEYHDPFFQKTTGEALRTWTAWCNNEETPMYKNPEDFLLLEVGEWDDDGGMIMPYEHSKTLGTAFEYKRSENVTKISTRKTKRTKKSK